ncbi:hypothetical protein FB451DRAFT_1557288 [Mycena latifolia]|nr:hypothetical protein FB451DRAFT_1557288 [Mycena latifolia]
MSTSSTHDAGRVPLLPPVALLPAPALHAHLALHVPPPLIWKRLLDRCFAVPPLPFIASPLPFVAAILARAHSPTAFSPSPVRILRTPFPHLPRHRILHVPSISSSSPHLYIPSPRYHISSHFTALFAFSASHPFHRLPASCTFLLPVITSHHTALLAVVIAFSASHPFHRLPASCTFLLPVIMRATRPVNRSFPFPCCSPIPSCSRDAGRVPHLPLHVCAACRRVPLPSIVVAPIPLSTRPSRHEGFEVPEGEADGGGIDEEETF